MGTFLNMHFLLGIKEIVFNFFSIHNVIFTIFGQGVSALEIISVIVGLLCVFCAVKGKVANFWFGYLYNILLFFLFLQNRLYSSMLLQPIALAINFYGHYRWTHPRSNEKDDKNKLKVTVYNNGQRTVVAGGVVIFMFVWGYLLSRIDMWWPAVFTYPATFPYFDAFALGLVLAAQWLSAQKKLDCWGVWLIADITNIILSIKSGLGFMPLVYFVYVFLAIGGFMIWLKMYRKQRITELKKEAASEINGATVKK
jgi:nicotinamide mononucleotide transporter